MFQNYKFNFPTENSEQLLSVFVSGSVVMTVILNTTFVLWLTAQSVHCTLLQPGCTKIFNGLDLIQFSVANGTAGDQLHLPFGSAVITRHTFKKMSTLFWSFLAIFTLFHLHPDPVRQLQLAASCAVCYRELN